MPLSFDISDELREKMKKLRARDSKKNEILHKKIKQIIESDEITIEHYKNLRNDMKEFKRVHIDKHFVLIFNYDKTKKHIIFVDFDHHDVIYGR